MKKLVFLTGAGMSAESGISTFRDSDGLWEKYPVEQVASIQGYERNPELVIGFYNQRRRELLSARPNQAHLDLVKFEKDYQVTVITQNVDDLHERAGSRHIIHLHGELMKACSTNDPQNPSSVVLLEGGRDIIMGEKARDGSQLRPFIVWFGEAVPMIGPAIDEVGQADVFVVIGTSLNVYPAAGLLNYVRPGARLYLIDPKPVNAPSHLHINVIQKKATEGVRELLGLLMPE